MRYRRSREIREHLEVQTRPPDYRLQRIAIWFGLSSLAIWTAWMVIFSAETSRAIDWLLNRPIHVAVPVALQSADYKSAQARFRSVDFAIAGAMTNLQITSGQVRETQSWQPGEKGKWLPAERTLRVSKFYSPAQCNLEFSRSVAAVGGKVADVKENSRSGELTFQIIHGSTVTHRLTIVPDGAIERRVGHLAIIIDDLELSGSGLAQRYFRIEQPLTFSINPWRSSAKKLARELDLRKQEVVIHLPMEPENYPRISPGRRAVLMNQSDQENRKVVRDAVTALPMARGVKNFMGSRVTTSSRIMEVVLTEIKKLEKFYIDSRTSSRSIGHKTAMQLGVSSGVSWGILDADDNQERIAAVLDRASFASLEYGPIILIAHARENTLAVLEQKMHRLALRGIQFVHASTLVTGGIEAN